MTTPNVEDLRYAIFEESDHEEPTQLSPLPDYTKEFRPNIVKRTFYRIGLKSGLSPETSTRLADHFIGILLASLATAGVLGATTATVVTAGAINYHGRNKNERNNTRGRPNNSTRSNTRDRTHKITNQG